MEGNGGLLPLQCVACPRLPHPGLKGARVGEAQAFSLRRLCSERLEKVRLGREHSPKSSHPREHLARTELCVGHDSARLRDCNDRDRLV